MTVTKIPFTTINSVTSKTANNTDKNLFLNLKSDELHLKNKNLFFGSEAAASPQISTEDLIKENDAKINTVLSPDQLIKYKLYLITQSYNYNKSNKYMFYDPTKFPETTRILQILGLKTSNMREIGDWLFQDWKKIDINDLITYIKIEKQRKDQTVFQFKEPISATAVKRFKEQLENVKEGLFKEPENVKAYYKYHLSDSPGIQIANLISLYNKEEALHQKKDALHQVKN